MYFARRALLMSALLCSSLVSANTPTVADLASIQAQRILLHAQLEKARAQSALNALGMSASSSAVGHTLPTLRLIYGSQGINIGLFVFAGGSTATAKAGDTLPGQLHVRSIELEGADLIDRHGRSVRVPLSSKPPTETLQSNTDVDNSLSHVSTSVN